MAVGVAPGASTTQRPADQTHAIYPTLSPNVLHDGINLVPFRDLSIKYLVSVQGWGNVALGGPFGFLYPFVFGSSGWRQMARAGVLFGSAIELTQLTISLLYGFAYRVIDVNDVLLNFTGVMLGYALLRATALLYRTVAGRGSWRSLEHTSTGAAPE